MAAGVQPETLQISAFADVNPRGFGLVQRSRTFDAFYDDEGRWELRPTLWIEPIGNWSDGDLRLLEIPVTTENNANILAQWRPKAGIAAAASCRWPTGSSGAGRLPRSRNWPSARRAAPENRAGSLGSPWK